LLDILDFGIRMNIFRNIKLTTRLKIIINILFVLMFVITLSVIYFERRGHILLSNGERINRDLNELADFVDNHLKRDKDLINLALRIADFKINHYADIIAYNDKTRPFRAIDPYANSPVEINIPNWEVDGVELVNNHQLVDEIKKITKTEVSIYQKSDLGYVNISTSFVNTSGERLVGDIILYASPISKTIESGNEYSGRLIMRNAWFASSYKPIFVNGKIQGIFYIGLRERLGTALKQVYEKRNYYKSGFSFLIANNGNLIIHPTRQNENLSKSNLFKNVLLHGRDQKPTKYQWPETGKGQDWVLHSKYIEQLNGYVCVTYPAKEMHMELNKHLLISVASFLVFFAILQFILFVSIQSLRTKLRTLRQMMVRLAKNQKIDKQLLHGEKEFMEISENAAHISEKMEALTSFAQGISNDIFSQTFPKIIVNDELGEALIKINDKLNEAMYNEHIRQKEEKLRTWESEGLSKFVGILQRNRDRLDLLCFELISNLVEYLGANLGALFFLNNENPSDVHFVQMATYAYEQKKILTNKIYPNQGLIGRLYSEKKTIYLSEIPEGYITITSGLGSGAPKNLIIVPLMIGNEVYGAIEIASFNILKGYQIEFIEKIGENIASTINNVLVNNKTRELLEQSREQSKLLSVQEEKMRKNLIELKNIQLVAESESFQMKEAIRLIEENFLMVKLSVSGEILSLNQKLAEFLGLEKAELIGKHYSDYSNLIPIDEYKNLISSWNVLMGGENFTLEVKVKSGTGKIKNVIAEMMPEKATEQINSIVVVGMEISE
jgi:PAS domain-containing protein